MSSSRARMTNYLLRMAGSSPCHSRVEPVHILGSSATELATTTASIIATPTATTTTPAPPPPPPPPPTPLLLLRRRLLLLQPSKLASSCCTFQLRSVVRPSDVFRSAVAALRTEVAESWRALPLELCAELADSDNGLVGRVLEGSGMDLCRFSN